MSAIAEQGFEIVPGVINAGGHGFQTCRTTVAVS